MGKWGYQNHSTILFLCRVRLFIVNTSSCNCSSKPFFARLLSPFTTPFFSLLDSEMKSRKVLLLLFSLMFTLQSADNYSKLIGVLEASSLSLITLGSMKAPSLLISLDRYPKILLLSAIFSLRLSFFAYFSVRLAKALSGLNSQFLRTTLGVLMVEDLKKVPRLGEMSGSFSSSSSQSGRVRLPFWVDYAFLSFLAVGMLQRLQGRSWREVLREATSLFLKPDCSLNILQAYYSSSAYSSLSTGYSLRYFLRVAASYSSFSRSICLLSSFLSSWVSLTTLRWARLSSNSALLSIFSLLVRVLTLSSSRVSLMRFFLMVLSRGVSVAKLGVWLTSSRMGSSWSLMSTSKPSMWKHWSLVRLSLWLSPYMCSSMGLPTSSVFTTSLSIFSLTAPTSSPFLARRAQTAVRDRLWPTFMCCSLVLKTNFLLFLLMAQLVRWMKLSRRFFLFARSYLSVANRASPSSQMQMRSGSQPQISTQMRRSNFRPSTSSGSLTYSCTMPVLPSSSSTLLSSRMPLPCEEASGLKMQTGASSQPSWLWQRRSSPRPEGTDQVGGKKLQCCGKVLAMRMRLRPRKFFLARTQMAGKWLIFCCSLSLKRSWASMCPSVQRMSHFSDLGECSARQPSSSTTASMMSQCVSACGREYSRGSPLSKRGPPCPSRSSRSAAPSSPPCGRSPPRSPTPRRGCPSWTFIYGDNKGPDLKYFQMHSSHTLTIRELPKTKKMAVDELHPVLKMQKNRFTLSEEERLNEVAMVHGSAMSMMLRHERQVLAQPERMPGLRSSFLSLESNLNRLNKIEFEDVFNRQPILGGPNAHELYMRQFN